LEKSATVSVEVYDLLGQHVRTIYSGEMTEGRHELGWDGTSSNGAAVSSGIYLYRVSDGNTSRTMRMSLYK
jgi:flagellar hook assembly protein FlgD